MKFNQTYRFLLVSVLILLSCENEKKDEKQETRNAPVVLVAYPEQHVFDAALQITGTARPNQMVTLYAMTNGYLKQLRADIGDFVKEGDVLASLENPELLREKESLEAELKAKQSIAERLNGIYKKTPQLTSLADVEKAQAEFESASAHWEALHMQIAYLQVKAPFAGVISNRFVDKGAVIQSGLNNSNAMPLFEIQDLQPLRLVIDVPETDAVLMDKGTLASVSFPELPHPPFQATISRIAYGLDATTRTMKVEVDLPNKDLKIRPGMYAKVEMQRSGHKDVLSVVNEAIGNVKGQTFVYVVEGSIARKVEVKTGVRDANYTELLEAAIQPTDSIVVKGKEFCSDGAVVRAKLFTTKVGYTDEKK
ncbi:MAG: efflux RND transporter periplasmic adaptor subunit [Cyclobacteriaceae bacterium]